MSMPQLPPDDDIKLLYDRKEILDCPVAGTKFHDIDDMWNELYVGAKLALVRERNNKYDKNAVAVACEDDYEGDPDDFDFEYILGYIPRTCNAIIASLLDMGWQDKIEAEISELKNDGPANDRLHIKIYLVSMKPKRAFRKILRLNKIESEEAWDEFREQIWDRGFADFMYGCYPCIPETVPSVHDNIVVMHQDGELTQMYMTTVVAKDYDDVRTFIPNYSFGTDCMPYLVAVVSGPVILSNEQAKFIENYIDEYDYLMLSKLDDEMINKMLRIFK